MNTAPQNAAAQRPRSPQMPDAPSAPPSPDRATRRHTPPRARAHLSAFIARLTAPSARPFLVPLLAVALALLVCFIAIWLTGKDPVAGYQKMFMGGLGSLRALGDSSTRAAILALTGLSVTIAFAVGLFNIGGEGQLVAGAIAAAFVGLFRPGDRIGVDPLIYPGVKGIAKLFGIQLVPLKHENGEISEEGLLSAWKNEGIKGLYVMPDLNNPTNHTMTEACRKMIAEAARELDLIILEDGINSLLFETPLTPIAALAPENTVFMLSLSKTILPALRLAYLHVPKRYTEAMHNALYHLNLSQSSLLLELASRLIVSGRLEELLSTLRANGWHIASNGFGQTSYGSQFEIMKQDADEWKAVLEPVVGTTDILLMPAKADIADWSGYTEDNERYVYLRDLGFRQYCVEDEEAFAWIQVKPDYVRLGMHTIENYGEYTTLMAAE